jgi:hypothetical protein
MASTKKQQYASPKSMNLVAVSIFAERDDRYRTKKYDTSTKKKLKLRGHVDWGDLLEPVVESTRR